MAGALPASRAATRVAFAVITLFVLAQVAWWLIFQERYISRMTAERLAAWQSDAATATLALQASGGDEAVAAELAQRHPHLRLQDGGFVVDEAARSAFEAEQGRYLRMFAFEGPFFGLVIIAALVFIGLSLRGERELKLRQQNFLSAVTHEFKTPISTLRLLIETALLRPLEPARQRDYLTRMAAELERLERTAEQVLASARLESSAEAPVLAPHELNALTSAVVERLRPGLEARGARLELRASPQPLPVSIDESAFALVLSNLLDNAVKYSPQPVKPVVVRLEARPNLAVLHVEDEGVGIGEGEAQRIFERFYRAGDEMTRESKGVGLGLHLVRSMVEAMNGWVRCANREEGRGACFTVVLPRRVELGEPAPPPALAGKA